MTSKSFAQALTHTFAWPCDYGTRLSSHYGVILQPFWFWPRSFSTILDLTTWSQPSWIWSPGFKFFQLFSWLHFLVIYCENQTSKTVEVEIRTLVLMNFKLYWIVSFLSEQNFVQYTHNFFHYFSHLFSLCIWKIDYLIDYISTLKTWLHWASLQTCEFANRRLRE